MPKIKYIDLHCDSVTESCKRGGEFASFAGQVNTLKLKKSGCAAQCFALFTQGENAAADFERFAAYYNAQIAVDPLILPVERYSDFEKAEKEGKIAAILTVENFGFLNGAGGIKKLASLGVKMASPVWNFANAFAYPNLIFKGGVPEFEKREARGLTEAGKEAVAALNENRMIIDISHLSDGGVGDALALSTAPIVASHSNCAAVHNVSRNLTDMQIKKIADKGGVVGLNYCRDFIGGESAFSGLLAHLKHLIKVGGEDVPALGSDFDGIPPYDELADCTLVPALFEYFSDGGLSGRVLEKLARGNFLRVFKEVVG
ncbi:MAG: dipeptidase [Clostridiales bacterium]|nr:dipeptidase [Clostridiales bacterium]